MKTTTLLLFFSLLFFGNVHSQELVSTTGDYYETANSNLEWSLGETFIETFQQGNVILTQGLHQSYFEITAIDGVSVINSDISIYPNPATEYFYIDTELSDLKYIITDLTGKTISEGKINGNTKIYISSYIKSIYLLNILENNNTTKRTFKIIKQ